MVFACVSRCFATLEERAKQRQTHTNTTKREGGDDLLIPKIASNLLKMWANLRVGRYKIGGKGCLTLREKGGMTQGSGGHIGRVGRTLMGVLRASTFWGPKNGSKSLRSIKNKRGSDLRKGRRKCSGETQGG